MGWVNGKKSTWDTGDAGDTGSISGSRRSPGGGHDNPLQLSCLENAIDKGAWQATLQKHDWSDWAQDSIHSINLHLTKNEMASLDHLPNSSQTSFWDSLCHFQMPNWSLWVTYLHHTMSTIACVAGSKNPSKEKFLKYFWVMALISASQIDMLKG